MRRRRSSSRSPESSRSRSRRSPSEYRSMTRSRSRSPSPARSRSKEKRRPLRSKYTRSSSSRSLSPPSAPARPPSHSNPISTIDLTQSGGNSAPPSWFDSHGETNAPQTPNFNNPPPTNFNNPPPSNFNNPPPSNFNNPPPSFSNPPPAQIPPMESKPIPSVGSSQMRFPPPSLSSQTFDNFQGNFSGYGSSFYAGENRNYPDSQPLNSPARNFQNYSAPPGPNYPPPMGNQDWNYPGNGNTQSGFNREFPNAPLPVPTEGPPPAALPPVGIPPVADTGIKNAAVEHELVQQKKALAVQREEYFKKRIAMTKDLKTLREQAESLAELGGSKSIVKQNNKLQDEMLQKIKSVDNVIEMLTHIIGDKEQIADLLKGFASALELPTKEPKANKSEKRRKSKSRSRSRSPSRKKKSAKKKSETPEVKINVEHYDPELHWCSSCNVFPRSAIEYLTHLHSDVHRMSLRGKKAQERPDEEFRPWRVHEPREPSPPTYKDAPSKRVPIRGVPFLVAATAWYCSLCKTWLGELELADRHLKGPKHASMYTEFVCQNPHWEVDWLRDRTRAYEKNSEARAKVEEISKQLASKKDKPEKPTEVNLDKLKEMLATVRKKAAEKGQGSVSNSGSSSESSSSDEDDDKQSKKKSKKKKGKEEEKKKKKKKPEDKVSEGKGDKKKKESDKKERSSEDRPDRGERPDRPEYPQYNNRGSYRGRGRSSQGRYDRGGRTLDRDRRSGWEYRRNDREDRRSDREDRRSDKEEKRSDRESKEKSERRSRDRESDDGQKNRKDSPERKRSTFRGDHDWERIKPSAPAARNPVVVGKRPGLGGSGISREMFGFRRKNIFDRLDKDKPDELYGPLEPPKNE